MVTVKCKALVQEFLMSQGLVLTMTMRYLRRKRNIFLPAYAGDYVRNSSLELVAHEISARKIRGSVAELGVYKGEFAKIINEAFPDRKLYLFDTFKGFDPHDVSVDKNRAYSSGRQDFSKTSIEVVLKKMKYPENCIVKPGYFPESASDAEDEFAFVSIDADLFQPIYDGLQFFFPRLVRGGFIFVHDYNNEEYKGANAAVRQYCEEKNIAYFPLTDACGSAIIAK
jgi:O-methyltransferase